MSQTSLQSRPLDTGAGGRVVRSEWLLVVLVFTAALLFRGVLVVVTESYRDLNRGELERVAISLATTGVHGNPYSIPTGPTAHITPGYVWILAVVFKVFGTGVLGEAVKQTLCAIVSALRIALLPWFALRVGLSRSIAVFAGILGIFWIGALDTELKGGWEAPYVALGLLLLIQYHYRNPIQEMPAAKAAIAGAFWGVLMLFSPVVLPAAVGLWIVQLVSSGRHNIGRVLRRLVIVALGLILVLLPWAIRNKRLLGEYIFTKDNFGLELWVAYHPGADWAMGYNSKQPGIHPFTDVGEAYAVMRMGEIEYNRQKLYLAIDWIQEHPREAGRLVALHVLHFWFPGGRNELHESVQIVFNILALAGFVMLMFRRHPLVWYIGSTLAVFPLIYYVVSASPRYRFPVEWMMVLLVAVVLGSIYNYLSSRLTSSVRAGSW